MPTVTQLVLLLTVVVVLARLEYLICTVLDWRSAAGRGCAAAWASLSQAGVTIHAASGCAERFCCCRWL